jgi:hypothetical protein
VITTTWEVEVGRSQFEAALDKNRRPHVKIAKELGSMT